MSSRGGTSRARGRGDTFGASPHASLDIDQEARDELARVFGRSLSDGEIVSLVGAQPHDTVEVTTTRFGDAKFYLDGHATPADRGIYTAERTISRTGNTISIHNESFQVSYTVQGKGIGAKVFFDQAHAASRLGVHEIYATAGRGVENLNGYYTWPRLGYNASLAGYESELPTALRGANDLHDLMRTQEGRNWWSEHGQEIEVTFDTRPGSKSMQVLDTYMRERRSRP